MYYFLLDTFCFPCGFQVLDSSTRVYLYTDLKILNSGNENKQLKDIKASTAAVNYFFIKKEK